MGLLQELGLADAGQRLMLINAPDSVLAEAGRMTPRPSFASTLQVGEPTALIAWWPERRLLNPGSLGRLAWMLRSAEGLAWLVLDADDEAPLTAEEVAIAASAAGLAIFDQRPVEDGQALLVRQAPDR